MDPVQIVLGNELPMPNAGFDKYKCWEEMLSVQVDMISGRRVSERRGKVWRASYQADYIDSDTLKAALAMLHSGAPIVCTVLTPQGGTVTSSFLVDSITRPTLMGFDGAEPIWRGLAFELREETPHKSYL